MAPDLSSTVRRVADRLTSPVTRTDLLQVLKATVAAVLAWVLADRVLGLPLVRHSQESRMWNPRRRRHPDGAPHGYADVLVRLEEGVSQTRSIARHLRESTRESPEWDPRFRERYLPLLAETGRRVADPHAEVADLREDLTSLVEDLSTEDLPGRMWPLHGALIANLRMVVDVVDDVATARPVRT